MTLKERLAKHDGKTGEVGYEQAGYGNQLECEVDGREEIVISGSEQEVEEENEE